MQPYNLAFIETLSVPESELCFSGISTYQFILKNKKLIERVLLSLTEAGVDVKGAQHVFDAMSQALTRYKTHLNETTFACHATEHACNAYLDHLYKETIRKG